MDNAKKERLAAAGIDVKDALQRFMENESMLERFLDKFTDDKNFSKLKEALDSGNAEAALEASHTLKGVSGNLSMTPLFDLLTEQVKRLREGNFEGAKNMMDKITEQYNKTVAAIRN